MPGRLQGPAAAAAVRVGDRGGAVLVVGRVQQPRVRVPTPERLARRSPSGVRMLGRPTLRRDVDECDPPDGGERIVIASSNGSKEAELPALTADDQTLSFLPSGRALAFDGRTGDGAPC